LEIGERIVTADDFRRLALSLPEVAEMEHMDHPDFRVGGKIFATLGYPDEGWGMVALTPVDQQLVVAAAPDAFVPATGAWGRRGATLVHLRKAKKTAVRDAMVAAWRARAPKRLASRV
jgi:hypothetical protein